MGNRDDKRKGIPLLVKAVAVIVISLLLVPLVIFTALPTASLLAAFTIQYDPSRDSQFEAAATVLLSTLLSAFTIPLWAAVLGVCYP